MNCSCVLYLLDSDSEAILSGVRCAARLDSVSWHSLSMTGGIMRVVIGVFTAAMAMSAAADQNAIDYRKHTMESIGGHMGALVEIAKGQVDHKDHIPVHTAGIAALSNIAPSVFPADSQEGD